MTYDLVETNQAGDSESAQTFATLSVVGGIVQKITVHTMDENDQGIHFMRLKMALGRDYYPTYDAPDFRITITQATCNCNLLIWDEPAEVTDLVLQMYTLDVQLARATINADSEVAEPAIRSCTGAQSCDRTSTVSLVLKDQSPIDSDFMTFDDTTMILNLAPTQSSQINVYNFEMTQTVFTGHAPIVMDVAIVEVNCVIETINSPTAPVSTIYHLMSTQQTHRLDPEFLQYPACDYALNESIVWDIETDAPLTVDVADDYTYYIESTNLDLHGIYTISVTNTVSYTQTASTVNNDVIQ